MPYVAKTLYRVSRHLDSFIMLQSIWGVPSACGPLLQLATAQAGQHFNKSIHCTKQARETPQIDVNRI